MARPVHSYGHRPGSETKTMSEMVSDCEGRLRGRVGGGKDEGNMVGVTKVGKVAHFKWVGIFTSLLLQK